MSLVLTDPNHKTTYPKKGVGYEPLGMDQPSQARYPPVPGLLWPAAAINGC